MKWAALILRLLLALAFTAAAIAKLLNLPAFSEQFVDWGYPAWGPYLIIGIELASAAGLLVDKTADVAAGVLILLMLGAVYTHFQRDTLPSAVPAAALLVMLAVLVLLRRRGRAISL